MKIEINTPYIKLDSLLKYAAVADSGGYAKSLIEDGFISVNGEKETRRGRKLYKKDVVTVRLEETITITVE